MGPLSDRLGTVAGNAMLGFLASKSHIMDALIIDNNNNSKNINCVAGVNTRCPHIIYM